MSNRPPVRLGIVGFGIMGLAHARNLAKVAGCELAALCKRSRKDLEEFAGIPWFENPKAMFRSGKVDAVLIATPHYAHTELGIAALKAGLHVLMEKPISVDKADCLKLLAAHRNPEQVFAAVFNQRTDPLFLKLRELVRTGTLGKIRRINWIITDWFRTEAYYAHGGWRGSWAGEGGGVLLNQCPHNLDLFQWIFGMPAKVRGFCQFGRYHSIEVEDDVTAYFQYADGTTGVFITSTGEAPGTNRLEVMAENGRIVIENRTLEFLRNETPATEFSRTTQEKFARPAVEKIQVPPEQEGSGEQHVGILKNFIGAIRDGESLIAPAAEGIHSVELANAILLSSMEERTVELPLSAPRFARLMKRLRGEGEAPAEPGN